MWPPSGGIAIATVGRAAANIKAIRVLRMVYLLVSNPALCRLWPV
jgi:hypothetical protein